MIYYFKDADKAEIMATHAEANGSTAVPKPEDHFHTVASGLAPVRAAFRGGAMARTQLLRRKIGETPDQWANRYNNFQNVPLIRTITNFKTSLLYVMPPERHLRWARSGDAEYDAANNEQSEELDEAFCEIYKANRADTLFTKQVGPRTNRDMLSWVKVWHDEENKQVRLTSYKTDNVLVVLDPKDSETAIGIVEIRPKGTTFDRILWTTKEYGYINESWDWIDDGPKPNPDKGNIPFVSFGNFMADMGNPLDDAVFDQQHLVNLRSHVAMGIRSQTYKQLWTAGKIKGPKSKDPQGDGNERLQLSPETVLQMDEGGSVNYASPDYPVSETLEAERQELKRALEMYRVSGISVDPSSAPDQPMSLGIKMLPSLWARQEDIGSFGDSERRLGQLVARYGAAFGYLPCAVADVESGAVEVCIDFDDTVMPADKAIERQADLADVGVGLMLRSDYYKKWQKPGADNSEVEADLALLDAQVAAKAAMTASAFGAVIPPRPPMNLAGATPQAGGNGQSNASALLARLGQPGDGVRTNYSGGNGKTGGETSSGSSSGGGGGPTGGGTSGGKTVPGIG